MSKKAIGLISSNNPLVLKRQEINNASGDEEENHDGFLEIDKEFGFKNKKKNNKKKHQLLRLDESDDELEHNDYNKDSLKSQKSDDDTDMFADSEDEKDTKEKSEEEGMDSENEDSNNVKLMDMTEFQKQIGIETPETILTGKHGKKSRFDEVEFADADDNYNNDERKNDSIKFTSFSLSEEMKEGRFDSNENFIRYENDTEKDQDSWLMSVKQSDIMKAKKEQERLLRMNNEYKISKNQLADATKMEDLLISLIVELEVDESCMELLKKLNNQVMKFKQKNKRKEQNTQELKDPIRRTKFKIKTITEIIDSLSKISDEKFPQTMIYEFTREELIRKYEKVSGKKFIKQQFLDAKSDEKGDENNDSNHNSKKRKYTDLNDVSINQDKKSLKNDVTVKQWEFKWIGKEDTVYGPYSTQEIKAWKETYFQNRVLIRNIQDNDASFINIRDCTI